MPTRQFSLFESREREDPLRDFLSNETWNALEGKYETTVEDEKKKRRKELAKQALGLLPFAARVMAAKTSNELQDALSDMTTVLEERKQRTEAIQARKAEQERDIKSRREDIKTGQEFTRGERIESEKGRIGEAEKERKHETEMQFRDITVRTKLAEAEQETRFIAQRMENDVRTDLARIGRQHDEEMFKRQLGANYTKDLVENMVNPALASSIGEKLAEGRVDDLNEFEKAGVLAWTGNLKAKDDQQRINTVLDVIGLARGLEVPVVDPRTGLELGVDPYTGKVPSRQIQVPELLKLVFGDRSDEVVDLLKTVLPESSLRTSGEEIGGEKKPIPQAIAETEFAQGIEEFKSSEFTKRAADSVKVIGTDEAAAQYAANIMTDPSMTEQKALGYIMAANFSDQQKKVAIDTVKKIQARRSLTRERQKGLDLLYGQGGI